MRLRQDEARPDGWRPGVDLKAVDVVIRAALVAGVGSVAVALSVLLAPAFSPAPKPPGRITADAPAPRPVVVARQPRAPVDTAPTTTGSVAPLRLRPTIPPAPGSDPARADPDQIGG